MQVDIGFGREARLLRHESFPGLGCRLAGAAAGFSFESRFYQIRGYDRRRRRADECTAEKHLPRLLIA
jgi:hypothetical protein